MFLVWRHVQVAGTYVRMRTIHQPRRSGPTRTVQQSPIVKHSELVLFIYQGIRERRTVPMMLLPTLKPVEIRNDLLRAASWLGFMVGYNYQLDSDSS